MLLIKSKSVNLNGLEWPIVHALSTAVFVYQTHKLDLTLTSAHDGVHMPSSLHYKGKAIDLRIKNIPTKEIINSIVEELKALLGDTYDVVLEKDHIHIEFDPKK